MGNVVAQDMQKPAVQNTENANENIGGEELDDNVLVEQALHNEEPLAINDFVAVKLVTKKSKLCFFAKITDIKSGDLCVDYLEKSDSGYQYPANTKVYLQNVTDIVCKLPMPEMIVSGSRGKCVLAHRKANGVTKWI